MSFMKPQKTIVIVHGWTGSSRKDWLPWLAGELRAQGFRVMVPDMPFSYVPLPAVWVPYLKRILGTVDENTYFIGHSVGCQTIMRMLAGQDRVSGGAVFVAGWFAVKDFLSPLPIRSFYKKMAGPFRFLIARWESRFDYSAARRAIPRSVVILSTNDKFVDREPNARLFQERLESRIVTVENAGHFTKRDGFQEFPLLLEEVLVMIKKS